MLWGHEMDLLANEKALIQNKYFRVWDIIEILHGEGIRSWEDVSQYLGHHDFDTELTLFRLDKFCRVHEVYNDYVPIRKLINELGLVWLKGDEALTKLKLDIIDCYWEKAQIYNFDPLMNLGLIEKPATQVIAPTSIQLEQIGGYRFFLYRKSLLTIHEAACIISGDDPVTVDRCSNDTNFDQNFGDYLHAYSLVSSAINAKELDQNVKSLECIKRSDFKSYLLSENLIIDGYTDALASVNDQPSIQQADPNIEHLNAEITRLRNVVMDKEKEIQDLKSKIEKQQPAIQNDKPDLLALIFDKNQTDRYAPDLAYSIKLWLDVYVDNPKVDSHNNRANTWIQNNTPYNGEQEDTPTRRIREIATPFRDFHQSRKKLLNNK
jgi:phosphotransferase system IIB component